MRRKHNHILIGLAAGILIPIVGYALALSLFDFLEQMGWVPAANKTTVFRQRTVALIAICTNILPMQYFQQHRSTQSMRGIIIATVLLAVIWFINFKDSLLG